MGLIVLVIAALHKNRVINFLALKIQKQLKPVISLPTMEGQDLSSAMIKSWKNLAASECRLSLMMELLKLGVGFAEIEEFNLDLSSKFRSKGFKEKFSEMTDRKMIKVAMEFKLRDEQKYNSEVNRERNILRKKLEETMTKNSKPYRSKIKFLRCEAAKVKEELRKKYEKKLNHLRKKYKLGEEEKMKTL